MKVKELIEALQKFPAEFRVLLDFNNGPIFDVGDFGLRDRTLSIKIPEDAFKVYMPKKEVDETDMEMIVKIADNILETTNKKDLVKMGEEGYYKRVLEQYLHNRDHQEEMI